MSINNERFLLGCEALAEKIGQALIQKRAKLTTAESCTGGWVSSMITTIAGSSDWFDRGFVTYSNQSKQEMLGVLKTTLEKQGAVSLETAREMAEGALKNSIADYSLAVTGIAGPTGGTAEKPVGTVWFAWAGKNSVTRVEGRLFKGNRHEIRLQSVHFALTGLLEVV